MSKNLEFWNDVCDTDPAHTKHVSTRGGFTAIDAQYQVMNATDAFGPVGQGWGYDCKYSYHHTVVVCELTFWYYLEPPSNEPCVYKKRSFGPIAGCSEMFGKKLDTDAPKKAMTDALTKAFSHLGFNADVFLGLYDDNKYVADKTEQFAKEKYIKQVTETIPRSDMEQYQAYVTGGDSLMLVAFMANYPSEDPKRDAFFASWPKGQITKMKDEHLRLITAGIEQVALIVADLKGAISREDEQGIVENWDDCQKIKGFIAPRLGELEVNYLKNRSLSKEATTNEQMQAAGEV